LDYVTESLKFLISGLGILTYQKPGLGVEFNGREIKGRAKKFGT